MNGKRKVPAEAAYLIGIVVLAFGTAFMEQADMGMSMVVAPAYLFYLKLSQTLPWFTFGMAEYLLQAVLLIALTVVLRRIKGMYLFSFFTAVFYGFTLDLCMKLIGVLPCEGFAVRILFYLIGMVVCAAGVSMLFHTYLAPEAYELVVKEVASAYQKEIHKVKTVYDCISCAVAVLLSFAFFGFGHFEGVKLGTVFCALVNGWLIGRVSRVLDTHFEFYDMLKRKGTIQ